MSIIFWKVTDSDTESDSSDMESLLSSNDPIKSVPYFFKLLLLQTMKIMTLREMFRSNHSAVVE